MWYMVVILCHFILFLHYQEFTRASHGKPILPVASLILPVSHGQFYNHTVSRLTFLKFLKFLSDVNKKNHTQPDEFANPGTSPILCKPLLCSRQIGPK